MDLKNWDAKTVIAALLFGGYYGLIFTVLMQDEIAAERLSAVDKMLSILGPIIGAAGQAIWRNSHADEVRTVSNAEVNRTNAATAQMAAGKAPPPTPAGALPGDTDAAPPAADPVDPWGPKP